MNDRPKLPPIDVGSVVAETFRIEDGVARGGFSTIYRARHIEMDRTVALKILNIDENIDAGALERFSREARLSSQINHPNVVTIFDFGQDDRGMLFIAMEWMDGDSLKQLVEREGPLAPSRVARIGRDLARGLAAVHQQDILHRDLKASNAMLLQPAGGGELAKLLDFGVATSADIPEEEQIRITQKGRFVGTPRYAAPEQIRGDELSCATDIYGLGLLLWEAVVGEPAVPEANFKECCSYHLSEEPWELPAEANCPKPLADVIHRALAKRPEDRFDAAVTIAEKLDGVLHSLEADPKAAATTKATAAAYTSSQLTSLIFAVLVAGGVGMLFAYPGLLSLTSDDEPAAMRTMSIKFNPKTPASLIDAAEAAGWDVEERDETSDGDKLAGARLTKGDEAVTFDVLSPSDDPRQDERSVDLVRFDGFTVRVRADGDAGPHFHRLTGELRLLQADHASDSLAR